ncbi:MAG: hypothetical protein HY701_11825, partial [Gemmatimonadetes bacterium]|nr:hypothetical protein [Gemmatimonadota bacterium]
MGRRSRTKTRAADQAVSQGAHAAAQGTAAGQQLRASGAGGVWLTPARVNLLLAAAVGALHLTLALATYFPAPHTGGDNASYITLGYSLLHDGAYRELWEPAEPPHTKYPPVFPLILATAMAAGAQTWGALKLVVILFTTLGAAFTYLWVAERSGRLLALGVSTLFAASASLVYASHWILSEAPFVALTLCALWACERAERLGFPTPWVLLGAAATILAYFTRSAGLPLVVALVAWLAERRRWRAAASAGVTFAVLAGAWWWRGRAGSAPSYVAEFW